MAFVQEPTRTPTEIRNIVIVLKDAFDEEGDPYQSAHFRIQIVLSDGTVMWRRGDLVPHITAGQRNALIQLMADLRAQAVNQIIP